MKFNKNLGMLLLAIFLIAHGIIAVGASIPQSGLILGVLAIVAGVFILIGK